MTPLRNELMNGYAGETYLRQFVLTRNTTPTTVDWVGETGWGAEFGMCNPNNPADIYAVATVANNKAAWVAQGIIWISFSQAETALWKFPEAAWYLDLIAPNTTVDPFGVRDTVLRGFMRCESRSPRHNPLFYTNQV